MVVVPGPGPRPRARAPPTGGCRPRKVVGQSFKPHTEHGQNMNFLDSPPRPARNHSSGLNFHGPGRWEIMSRRHISTFRMISNLSAQIWAPGQTASALKLMRKISGLASRFGGISIPEIVPWLPGGTAGGGPLICALCSVMFRFRASPAF